MSYDKAEVEEQVECLFKDLKNEEPVMRVRVAGEWRSCDGSEYSDLFKQGVVEALCSFMPGITGEGEASIIFDQADQDDVCVLELKDDHDDDRGLAVVGMELPRKIALRLMARANALEDMADGKLELGGDVEVKPAAMPQVAEAIDVEQCNVNA